MLIESSVIKKILDEKIDNVEKFPEKPELVEARVGAFTSVMSEILKMEAANASANGN